VGLLSVSDRGGLYPTLYLPIEEGSDGRSGSIRNMPHGRWLQRAADATIGA
jgi:hypothetical protein